MPHRSTDADLDSPGYSYLNGLTGTSHDWQYTTTNQTNSGNVVKSWPRGKLLGGSGAINGMFFCRASETEYDAWATLNPNGNQTWNWAEMYKYMRKSENYTAPPAETISDMGLIVNSSAHGSGGPIQSGYSEWIYPANAEWIPTWVTLGMTAKDLADGNNHGVSLTTSTLNARNQSRSDSKAGYIDPLAPRSNLVILTGQQVTKVIFNGTTDASGNAIASGVQFSASSGAATYSVQANKEVILCGGTIGSPQMLQLSGIGPSSVLEAVGVTVLKDLPVGYNLQDHVSATQYWNTVSTLDNWAAFNANTTDQAVALTEWRDTATGKWTYINEAVGYVDNIDITGSATAAATFASAIDIATIVSDVNASHSLPSTVQTGLTAQYTIMKEWLTTTGIGQFELILQLWGASTTSLGIQVALQHPWSRGTLFINSDSAFDKPTINPDYFGVSIDAEIGVNGWNWARKIGAASPMNTVMTNESSTTSSLTGDTLSSYYTANCGTEYHPLGTCSMLPEDSGGVVDTNLIVYGTNNLRVIDASIMPMHISAHLMASTYGIAEKGADIIKEAHWYVAPAGSSSTAAAAASTASVGTATDSSVAEAASDAASSSALSMGAKIGIGAGIGAGAIALIGALIFFCVKRKNKKGTGAGEKEWYSGDQGAWDANQAYTEQNNYPMQRPPRPFSSGGASVSTMATSDLSATPRMMSPTPLPHDADYQMGDYQRGGATSPFRDTFDHDAQHSGYSTPGFATPGTATGFGAQQYTPVTLH